MIKKLVLIIRDYIYLSWLKKSNDPEYAWRQQKQLVIVLLVGWYFALCTSLAMISYKMSWSIFPQPANFLMTLVYGSIMFAPYVGFMSWWLDTLDGIPVNETRPYQRKGLVAWSVFITGVLVALLMPALLQKIIPSVH